MGRRSPWLPPSASSTMAGPCHSAAPSPTSGRPSRCSSDRRTGSRACVPSSTSAHRSSLGVDMKALVVGGGTMGAGIAQVFLEAGADVVLAESTDELAVAARGRVVDGLGRAKADVEEALTRFSVIVGIDGGLDVELAVEAVPEDPELKARVLSSIEAVVPDDAVIATNTSSLSIDAMSASLRHPQRF